MTWFSIIVSGIVTYFSRMAMVALIDREMLGTKVKEVLNYVPAAVFPAIIFPGVFFNDFGSFVEITDPKIYGAMINCWFLFKKCNCYNFFWIIILLVYYFYNFS